MPRPIVFLSHTSRLRSEEELHEGDTPAAHRHRKRYIVTLLDELVARLHERGLEPWRDRLQVEPGDDFQREVAYGLARCDAAILLVDRDALRAGFMRDEAVFLAWRNVIEDDFQLVPVLLGGVTTAEFNNSPLGAAAGMSARSSVLEMPAKASYRTAAEHARHIAESMRVMPLPDPIAQAWVDEVEHLLGSAPRFALDRAAAALGFDPSQWRSLEKQPRRLAAVLLHVSLVDGIKVFGHVKNQLGARDRRRLARLITPLWVELPKASALIGTAMRENSPRIAIGSGSLELAAHAVQRGLAQHHGLQIQKLPAIFGEGGADELVEEFDQTIREDVGLLPDATPEEIAADLEATEGVVFALVAANGIPQRILIRTVNELTRRLPGVIFVLVAPPTSPSWRKLKARKHPLTSSPTAEREVMRQVQLMRARMRDDED